MPRENLDKTLENLALTLKKTRELITTLRQTGVTKLEVVDEKTGDYFAYPRPHPFDPIIAKVENQSATDSTLPDSNPVADH